MKSPQSFFLALLGAMLVSVTGAASAEEAAAQPLFDLAAIRDTSNLETTVLRDWAPYPGEPGVRQKFVEITVCEWWPGQKVRLPVTLSAPAEGGPCKNVLVANQGLSTKAPARLSPAELMLVKEHGVGVALIGMSTIDAMEPVGQLHNGMREWLLKTKDVRYTPAWIWGMSQMRALTAAAAEPDAFQPEKVLATGGSKRGVATAVAGIQDSRFTAIMPVVAPPLGNPGGPVVRGTEPDWQVQADKQFFADLAAGKLGLEPAKTKQALEERDGRRANQRITLEQAQKAGWTEQEIADLTPRSWDMCRTTSYLQELRKRGLEIFYNVGTNDSVSPELLELGKRFPDFPICIIPGGQHGGPATAGFTRRVPLTDEVKNNFVSFALHHFFDARDFIAAPNIKSTWNADSRVLEVTVTFPDGTEPEANALWWSLDRHRSFTLPFEYDSWQSTPMKKTGPAQYQAQATLDRVPERLDFLTLHTQTQNGLPLSVSSPYQRINP